MSRAEVHCNETLERWREARMWVVWKRNADGSMGPFLKRFSGRFARLRSWWFVVSAHVIDPPAPE